MERGVSKRRRKQARRQRVAGQAGNLEHAPRDRPECTHARQHGLAQTGVRNLAGIIMGIRIPKGARTSNWAAPRLTAAQITYANNLDRIDAIGAPFERGNTRQLRQRRL